ncbi:MAG: hypothetical protein ACOX8R_04935 [Bacillota bacterium]|jgi:hypothetical protein
MFIEGLRRAKNKWRIVVGVLMGLIVISLLLTFANFGNKVDTSGVATNTTALTAAETAAENAASAAKSASGDMTVQGEAASAYLTLAAYQDLYLEDPAKSYQKALTYAKAMVEACGSTQEPDYETAYGYEFSALKGLGDGEGLSAAFNESLGAVTVSQDYLNSYAAAMIAVGANEQLVTDLETVKTKLAEDPTIAAEDEAAEDGGDETAAEEPDLNTFIDSLIEQAAAQ